MASPSSVAEVKTEGQSPPPHRSNGAKANARGKQKDAGGGKRKCVSTACIACRRRKSKCDGNLPSCAACASVYGTECVYDPNSDHRRKGVYKKGVDSSKTQDSTLKILVEGILNYPEHEVMQLVKQIRSCENLEDVAQLIVARNTQLDNDEDADRLLLVDNPEEPPPRFERELLGKVGELKLENGATQFLGGTSNLLYVDNNLDAELSENDEGQYATQEDAIRSWTSVTTDTGLILHLLYMYFTWHYTYFTTLSRSLFFRDFLKGKPAHSSKSKTTYCTPLLVNAMLTLGCHFTSWPAARADPEDSATAGDHFMEECKKILVNTEDYEVARIVTVQALALMSVREAGCAREAKGWFYSGMSFRMACDMGLPYETSVANLPDDEVDARRMTFWGCYLFDKCWSNYLGRQPQLALDNITLKKFDVFPLEDSDLWSPWTDGGLGQTNIQPARTRAIALQISALCETSSDLLHSFYRPTHIEKPLSKQAEVQKLSDLQIRLEAWRTNLPKEFEAKEGQLPQVLVMHMFFNLLFIHLFRPFLKYTPTNSPLPSHVSPRKQCTQAAASISKYLRMYKKTHGLRQICNIVVYIAHSACTIHLLNLPDRNAQRDLTHGLTHLEEIAESWLCARRTLMILAQQIEKWQIQLPEEAAKVLARADSTYHLTKSRHGGSSETGSPATDIFGGMGQENALSPTTMGRFDFNMPPAGLSTLSNPGQPPISQNARVRSNSSARRSELLRQMQQNSFQSQISSQQYQLPGSSEIRPKAGNGYWRGPTLSIDAVSNAMNPAVSATHASHQMLQDQEAAQTQTTGSPGHSSVASPTTLFAPAHQQKALYEEQKDWWLRDQTSIFDNWMQRDGIDGSGNSNGTPAAMPRANGIHQGAPELASMGSMGLYNGMTQMPTGTGGQSFENITANADMPPGWEAFNIQADGSAQQGNVGNNFGGFSTGIL